LARSHTLAGKPIKIQPYYKWLGIQSGSGNGEDGSGTDDANRKVPPVVDGKNVKAVQELARNPVSIPCDINVINYLQKTPIPKREVETRLLKENCEISWPQSPGQAVELRFKKSDSKQTPDRNWSDRCRTIMEDFLSGFQFDKIDILQELWKTFRRYLEESIQNNHYLVKHMFDDDNCVVVFVGKKESVEEFSHAAESIKKDLELELSNKKQNISESPGLKPHQALILYIGQYKNEVCKLFPAVIFTSTPNEFNLNGPAEAITRAKINVLQKVTELKSNSINVSKPKEELLKCEEMKGHLVECFGRQRVLASWEVRDKYVMVFGYTEDAVAKACEIIHSEIVETEIPMEGMSARTLLSQPKWKEFVKKLRDENRPLVVDCSDDAAKVLVLSTKEKAEKVAKSVHEFIDKNTIEQQFVPMMRVYVDLFTRCMAEDLKRIDRSLTESGGSLKTSQDVQDPGFNVQGSRSAVAAAVKKLNNLADNILPYDHDIDRPGVPEYLFGHQDREVLRSLEQRHCTAIELENGKDDEPSASPREPLEAKFKRQVIIIRTSY